MKAEWLEGEIMGLGNRTIEARIAQIIRMELETFRLQIMNEIRAELNGVNEPGKRPLTGRALMEIQTQLELSGEEMAGLLGITKERLYSYISNKGLAPLNEVEISKAWMISSMTVEEARAAVGANSRPKDEPQMVEEGDHLGEEDDLHLDYHITGDELRGFRKSLGMTAEMLCALLGVCKATVYFNEKKRGEALKIRMKTRAALYRAGFIDWKRANATRMREE